MITFYLVRHGQTEANVMGIRPGDLPTPLTRLGREQAAKTGESLSHIALDAVYASDYVRTRETAAFIMKHQTCDLTFDPRLRDLLQGEFLGLTNTEINARFPEIVAAFDRDPINTGRPRGESFREVMERAWSFMKDTVKLWPESEGTEVAVISHGGVINMMVQKITSIYEPKIVDNCSISVIRFDRTAWSVLRMDDVSHLREKSSDGPPNLA